MVGRGGVVVPVVFVVWEVLADEGGDDGAGGAGDSVGGAGEDADDRVDEATEDGNSHVRYSFLEGGVASIK
jgi:hypothetical protein